MDRLLLDDTGLAEVFGVATSTVRSWKSRGQIPEKVIFKLQDTKRGTTRYIKERVDDWINGRL